MKPEQQRIKLAEWRGYKRNEEGWWTPPDMFGMSEEVFLPPDYPSDLNAVHELEKRLSAREKGNYASKLFQICNISEPQTERQERDGWFIHIHATAAQRCEALLKTLGLWEEEAK